MKINKKRPGLAHFLKKEGKWVPTKWVNMYLNWSSTNVHFDESIVWIIGGIFRSEKNNELS